MYTYIKKSIIGNYLESDVLIDTIAGYVDSVGSTWEDYENEKFLLLTQNHLDFMAEHPEITSIKNIWDMSVPQEPEMQPEIQQTAEELLASVKTEKINELEAYDSSEDVNGFCFGGQTMWIAPSDRANYLVTLQGAQRLGVNSVTFLGVEIPVANAIYMLDAINIYAMTCVGVTDAHKAAINALETIEEIDAYDFTVGYPENLSF